VLLVHLNQVLLAGQSMAVPHEHDQLDRRQLGQPDLLPVRVDESDVADADLGDLHARSASSSGIIGV